MKKIIILLFLAFSLNAFSTDNKHFLKDPSYREKVHQQFEKRKKEAAGRGEALFSILKKEKLSMEQREALEFLFAFMPLCDLADYDGKFYLDQVTIALKARDYFPWGKTIPEDIFRHFVLPYRVNNENLDTARIVCFYELKDRIKHLSLRDAVLEVNHWCHEKATYRGSDMRTSGPLSLIRTSWGRCGEESTLTTTALRAVGIPARQCYTPRWAHTESNHAWVEVWIDGQWHFIGACEPEAELDIAWFVAPSKRAMMIHTTVFGLYNGPEEKNTSSALFTSINLLDHYAETHRVRVHVVDENDHPLQDATVNYNVFNGGNLSPVYTNTTDENGDASILTGKGDLFIWACKDERFGYKKVTAQDEDNVIKLGFTRGKFIEEEFIMNVPPEQTVSELSPDAIAENAILSAKDDSIRNFYMQTFITEEAARKLAREHHLNEENVWKYLYDAQGNWREIWDFILHEKANPDLFPFLASLTAKDLRDTPFHYLCDHLQNRDVLKIKEGTPENLVVPFILSPRIENELITPWRSFLQKIVSEEIQTAARTDIEKLVALVKAKVKINKEENYYECPVSPRGVYELGIADERSRNILFVALARSFGIPARTTAGNPLYFENDEWKSVSFDENQSNQKLVFSKGNLAIKMESREGLRPNYSIATFSNGDFRTRGFGWGGNRRSDGNRSGSENASNLMPMDAGYYRLLSGTRNNDGSAHIFIQYFEIKENETHNLTIKYPSKMTHLEVKGKLDMNNTLTIDNEKNMSLKALSNGKGLAVCFLDPGKEPSKHILQDFPTVQNEIQAWEGGVLFIIPDDKISEAFTASAFNSLPAQTVWATDIKRTFLNRIKEALQIELTDNFPLTLYISDNGDILYSSVGYKIGTGRDILNVIQLEKKEKQN